WQRQEKWAPALNAVKRAEAVLAGDGDPDLMQRIAEQRANLTFALRLEEVRLERSQVKGSDFDYATSDRVYADTFREHGIDVANLPTDEAVERIRARKGITSALVTALDTWAFAKAKRAPEQSRPLFAVSQGADPDPWRKKLRAALTHPKVAVLEELAASP